MAGQRGRPLAIAWQAGDDAAALKAAYEAERRRDVRPRLHALWLLRTGRGVREVASILGMHERTVQRWVGWYRRGGLAAVAAHRQAGRGQPTWLTAEQQAALVAQAATGAFRIAQEAQLWVAHRFGDRYTASGMASLLHRLRIHPKVPRPRNPKADCAQQDRWKGGASPTPSPLPG